MAASIQTERKPIPDFSGKSSLLLNGLKEETNVSEMKVGPRRDTSFSPPSGDKLRSITSGKSNSANLKGVDPKSAGGSEQKGKLDGAWKQDPSVIGPFHTQKKTLKI